MQPLARPSTPPHQASKPCPWRQVGTTTTLVLDCRTSSLNSAPRLAGLQTPQDHLKDGLSAGVVGKGSLEPRESPLTSNWALPRDLHRYPQGTIRGQEGERHGGREEGRLLFGVIQNAHLTDHTGSTVMPNTRTGCRPEGKKQLQPVAGSWEAASPHFCVPHWDTTLKSAHKGLLPSTRQSEESKQGIHR